jgi:hypothetical protein
MEVCEVGYSTITPIGRHLYVVKAGGRVHRAPYFPVRRIGALRLILTRNKRGMN